ncbi:MAG: hypothetical protein ACLQHK_06930 [Gallionellaceae bacterium]
MAKNTHLIEMKQPVYFASYLVTSLDKRLVLLLGATSRYASSTSLAPSHAH